MICSPFQGDDGRNRRSGRNETRCASAQMSAQSIALEGQQRLASSLRQALTGPPLPRSTSLRAASTNRLRYKPPKLIPQIGPNLPKTNTRIHFNRFSFHNFLSSSPQSYRKLAPAVAELRCPLEVLNPGQDLGHDLKPEKTSRLLQIIWRRCTSRSPSSRFRLPGRPQARCR